MRISDSALLTSNFANYICRQIFPCRLSIN